MRTIFLPIFAVLLLGCERRPDLYEAHFPMPTSDFEQEFVLENQPDAVIVLEFKVDEDVLRVFTGGKEQGSLRWTSAGVIDSGGDMLVPVDTVVAKREGVLIHEDAETITFDKPGFHAVTLQKGTCKILKYSVGESVLIAK